MHFYGPLWNLKQHLVIQTYRWHHLSYLNLVNFYLGFIHFFILWKVLVKLSPPKTKFFCQVMISLSVQNILPFFVLHLFPSSLRRIKEKRGLKPYRALLGTKAPPPHHVPHFLFVEKKKGFSLLGLSWVHVPDAQWGQTNRNIGVWSRERFIARAKQGEWAACAQKTLSPWWLSGKGF